MTQGLGGFAFGEDAVAAKLSLELPNDSEQILSNLARYGMELQTSMEATARATGSYMEYLRAFPSIQRDVLDLQKEQLQVLRDTASATQALQGMGGGAGFIGVGVGQQPVGYNDAGRTIPPNAFPDGNGNYRIPPGYERFPPGNQQVGPGGSPGSYSNNPTERQNALIQEEIERQNRIRDRVNEREENRSARRTPRDDSNDDGGGGRHRADSGRHRRPSDESEEDSGPVRGRLEDRLRGGAHGAAGGLEDATRIIGPGASNTTRLQAIARLLGRVPNPDDDQDHGSGLGGLLRGLPTWAKVAGGVGAGIGGAALINGAVQNTGEAIQGLRNQDLRGHSLGGGLQVESDIRLMALNPLLTNEQSREIIMGALRGGYQGKQYDSAVDFVKKNLLDMNIEVSKSFELLRSNVNLGGQSTSGLNFDLATQQQLAQFGPKTTDQLMNDFSATNSAFTNAGMNASASGDASNFAGALFNTTSADGSPNPIGVAGADGTSPWTRIVQAVTQNAAFTSIVFNRYVPNAAGLTDVWDKAGKDANRYIYLILQEFAKGSANLDQFKWTIKPYGILGALDNNDSLLKSLYEQLKDSKNNALEQADQQIVDANTMKVGGKDVVDLPTFEEFKAQPGNENATQADYNKFIDPSGGGDKPKVEGDLIRKIVQSDQEHKMVIVDPNGKAHLLDPQSFEQAQGLAKGTWKIVEGETSLITDRDGSGNLNNGNGLPGSYQPGGGGITNQTQEELLGKIDLSSREAISAGQGWTLAEIQGNNSGRSQQDPGYANGGNVDMGGNPTASVGGGVIELSAEGKKLFNFIPFAGNVSTDPTTAAANSGANSAQKNDRPPVGGYVPYGG